jgi:hypothetical protein
VVGLRPVVSKRAASFGDKARGTTVFLADAAAAVVHVGEGANFCAQEGPLAC